MSKGRPEFDTYSLLIPSSLEKGDPCVVDEGTYEQQDYHHGDADVSDARGLDRGIFDHPSLRDGSSLP